MKTPCITAIVLCALSSAATAQSSVAIFGVVDAAVRRVNNDQVGSITSLVSGGNASSRWGFRGVEDMGGGLRAGFWLEGDFATDTGVMGAGFNRRSTVSLSSLAAGELRAGRDFVPSHVASCSIDPFACVGILSATTYRSTQAAVFSGIGNVQLAFRANNSLSYLTPDTLAGFSAQVTISAGEKQISAGSENSDGRGLRVGYRNGPLLVQAATWQIRNTTATVQDFKDDVIGASYDFGLVKVGVQRRSFSYSVDKLNIDMAHLSMPMGTGTLKFSYMHANQRSPNVVTNARDSSTVGVGYQYNLSKRSSLYGTVARVSNGGTAIFTVAGGPAVTAANFGGRSSTGYEIGMRHDF